MVLVIAFAVLLLFLSICVAIVMFSARRYGWKPVLQYLCFSVAGRIVAHFAFSKDSEAEQNFLPLIWAGVIVWLLPHIIRQRDLEHAEELKAEKSNRVSDGIE